MSWRLAHSLDGLRDEVDERWPKRSKASDGTLGDKAHAARPSDHNPNAAGVVRALDITADGINAPWYAEHIRTLGEHGHPALRNHGYVIYNRRTAAASSHWQWVPYTGGPNPHVHHVHVSVGRDPDEYDAIDPWQIADSEEDLMAELTASEQRELLDRVRTTDKAAAAALLLATSVDQRCARLEASIHGGDTTTRGDSIWWRINYLYSEVLDHGNAVLLRRILHKFGASP